MNAEKFWEASKDSEWWSGGVRGFSWEELWPEAKTAIGKIFQDADVGMKGCKHIYGFEEHENFTDDAYYPGAGFLVDEPGQAYTETVDIQFTFCPMCGERLRDEQGR